MKKIFIFLVLIGLIKVTTSFASYRALMNIETARNDLEFAETPVFRNISSNLFMVLDIALRVERLCKVRVTADSEVYNLRVEKKWRADEYLLMKG